jgi:hypothetical protein
VFLCGVTWCKFGQEDAAKEILRALEFLALSELLPRLKVVFQSSIYVHLVFFHCVLLFSIAPRRADENCALTNAGTSRRVVGDEGFDLIYFFICEAELAGEHDSFGLTRIAGADNRSGHRGMVQCPRDCDFSG